MPLGLNGKLGCAWLPAAGDGKRIRGPRTMARSDKSILA
jgi:hypothetical protein